MRVYEKNEGYRVINGDSREVLDTLPENSVDAIVTDPPYELNFMSKGWDRSGIAFDVSLWKKALRVLKPGGHLLAFGGSRTFHRIACAIEDAGFEVRDVLMWLYGSGFPKSMNVGFQVDKIHGVDNGTGNWTKGMGPNNTVSMISGTGKNAEYGSVYEERQSQNEWAGSGTHLKPAYEPIVLCRKPLDGTIAENCLKWGVGAINIDGCRVGNDHFKQKASEAKSNGVYGDIKMKAKEYDGRFPANILADGSEEVAEGFDDSGSVMRYFYSAKASKKDRDEGLDRFELTMGSDLTGRKEGSKGLVFIEEDGRIHSNGYAGPNAPKRNFHPTVKPVELMGYLVRLITPRGGLVLDIFNGSGSTGKAVAFENRERGSGYRYVGIELNPDYCEISEARIDHAIHKYKYEFEKEQKEMKERGQLSLFDFFGKENDK